MSATLWVDPTFGASGDMLLGALAGLVDDASGELGLLSVLGVDGWTIRIGNVTRNGLAATRVQVDAEVQEHGRRWSEIDAILANAELPRRVTDGARRTFRSLAEVEAAEHGVAVDEVHFHEVGAIDAIVDITGVWVLVDAIETVHGPLEVVVGPVGLGHGTVEAAHGTLPLPAPATVALLEGCPVRPLDHFAETCTPTGAALLTTLADRWGALPAGRLGPVGRGAGGRDPSTHPNVVSALLVHSDTDAETLAVASPPAGQLVDAVLIETNVDDVTAEVLAHTVGQLLDAGADDAWVVPVIMKKGRAAHEVRVLCRPDLAPRLRAVLAEATGSLGSRTIAARKEELPRETVEVEVHGGVVSVKVGPHGAKPEHDDLVALAARTGLPLRRLAADVLHAWREQSG